jgi:hypothetical protein
MLTRQLKLKAIFSGADASDRDRVANFLLANPYFQLNPTLAAQGIILPTRLDPVALNYFKAGLVPTSSSGILFSQGAAKNNIDEYLGRFDYNITSKDVLSGTFSHHNETILEPLSVSRVVSAPMFPTTDFRSITMAHLLIHTALRHHY